MKKKRMAASVLVSAALFLGLFQPMPASAADLYFTAVNNSVAPLASDTAPLWSNGSLYVPYSVFDANLNGLGVSLGLYTNYNRSSNTVTLFNLRQALVFDLNSGTCWDDTTKTEYSARAVLRNGKPYLPLNTVSSFFDLSYSHSQLPYISQGYLVRIKNSDAVNDDANFIEAARGVINNRLRDYTQGLSSVDTTAATSSTSPSGGSASSGSSTAKPSVSQGTGTNTGAGVGAIPGVSSSITEPAVDPEDSDDPAPPAVQEPDETETAAYLAFRCESADGLSALLSTLDANGRSAVLFLTPQLLEEEGDLVRRALGTGQSVGILADGGEDVQERLARGNAALEAAAHARTTLAYVPAGQRTALEDQGWVCWNETALFQPDGATSASSFASSAIRRLKGQGSAVYLTLESGEIAVRVLPTLLRQLDNNDYVVSVPVETRL